MTCPVCDKRPVPLNSRTGLCVVCVTQSHARRKRIRLMAERREQRRLEAAMRSVTPKQAPAFTSQPGRSTFDVADDIRTTFARQDAERNRTRWRSDRAVAS